MRPLATNVRKHQRHAIVAEITNICWIFLIYLLSELVIWGLSGLLAPAQIEFFSSIISMVLVLVLMSMIHLLWKNVDEAYQRALKAKVDFINSHMGIGFPVPIVMLNEDDILQGREIACILGNAVLTSVISWTTVSLLSFLSWSAYLRTQETVEDQGISTPLTQPPPQIEITWYSEPNVDDGSESSGTKAPGDRSATPRLAATRGTSPHGTESPASRSPERGPKASSWYSVQSTWSVWLAIVSVLLIGTPIAAATADSRVLDAFVLWFIWILAVTIQRALKVSNKFGRHVRSKGVIATMMNPVLMTTLLMVGYTRVKARAMEGKDLGEVLRNFSAGTPLYALWTAQVRHQQLPQNTDGWFGAGDAALSLLECGIFIWGFKLYECRRQLFSMAGVLTIVVSIVAAVGNVFLSVLAARAMGLEQPEALAFAARSVTLALSKPAIEAVGGNTVVNAALVVGNGILGQLIYPFALENTGVKGEAASVGPTRESARNSDAEEKPPARRRHQADNEVWLGYDDPATVAAGIAIGINGAAMGVAYLYETKSRAAPYAAMSMTVFGIMTVIFTTVGPFKTLVMNLAGG
ncbi:lrgB-like family protein [Sarocladium implicatum]|nr:lrgB-like family protein [Sarocladium implicatum]